MFQEIFLILQFKSRQNKFFFFDGKIFSPYLRVQNKTLLLKIKKYGRKLDFFSNIIRYVDHTLTYYERCLNSLGRKFKEVNKVSIFTIFQIFLILFLASLIVEK